MDVATPWTGTWIDAAGPLAANDDLILTVASRRSYAPETVREKLEL